MAIVVNCQHCGKVFEVSPSRFENVKDLCCSRACSSEFKKIKKLEMANVQCYICKKPFYMRPSHIEYRKNKDRICCSMECAKKEKAERFSGEGNHQYGLKRELNASYKSDIKITNYGYVKCADLTHPLADEAGYVLFHRVVMEEWLKLTNNFFYLEELNGRIILPRHWLVHHKDGNKLNNVIENLEILSIEEHASLHHKNGDIGRARINKEQDLKGKIKTGKLYRATRLDAGQDVFANETVVIAPKTSEIIGTDLRIEVPEGYVGLLWSRSGLSVKHKIEVGAGCIDSGYRGEVLVHLYNYSEVPFTVEVGSRIAQLLTVPVNLQDYEVSEELTETERGQGGFGSTGTM